MLEELRRIHAGPRSGEKPEGIAAVKFVARCSGNAPVVLARVREALETVLSHSAVRWPTDEEWSQVLPLWITQQFVPERSREQLEEWLHWWRSLPPIEQGPAARAQGWSLGNWIHWFRSEERHWSWWSAAVLEPGLLQIEVVALEWPFPSEALEWLVEVAGAESVEKLDEAE